MQLYSITSPKEREALTLSLLEHVTPLLRRFAASDHLDFEELYQDACVWVLHDLNTKFDHMVQPYAYAMVAVHHRILDKLDYLKRRRAASLDESLGDTSSSFSLLDVLPDPYSVEPLTVVLAKERLEELRVMVSAAKWPHTRRMLSEMYDTAQAAQC